MSAGRPQKSFTPGQQVGEWTLLEYLPGVNSGGERMRPRWKCRCSCGTEKTVQAERLVDGASRSCGHRPPQTVTLADQVRELADVYGGLRALARALAVDASYLSRLLHGERLNPSDEMLEKLGLQRVVAYARTTPPDQPLRRKVSAAPVNSVFALGAAA